MRTRLVLTFISLTLLPTLFLFIMAWQLIGSRVDHSWDRQVEESLDMAIDLTRTFSQEMEDNLKAYGHMLGQELKEQERLDRGTGIFSSPSSTGTVRLIASPAWRSLTPNGRRWPPSYDPQVGHLPGLPAPGARGGAFFGRSGHPAEGRQRRAPEPPGTR